MKLKHIGFSADRLLPEANNQRERAFASAWKQEGGKGPSHTKHTIEYLIPACTERDAQVAATVIQWLGSNVGMGFLHRVVNSNKQIKEFLQ